MKNKKCIVCGKAFRPRPQTPQQVYCKSENCQRTRRREWQQKKLKTDPDYKANQTKGQKAWVERHPEYWGEYRSANSTYVERNRSKQKERNARQRNSEVAKIGMEKVQQPVPSGIYRIEPLKFSEVAKMDVWTVKITKLSDGYPFDGGDCKDRT
jgi:hypothetical protein